MPWWTCAECHEVYFTTHEEADTFFSHCQCHRTPKCPQPDGSYCAGCQNLAKRTMAKMEDVVVPKDPTTFTVSWKQAGGQGGWVADYEECG